MSTQETDVENFNPECFICLEPIQRIQPTYGCNICGQSVSHLSCALRWIRCNPRNPCCNTSIDTTDMFTSEVSVDDYNSMHTALLETQYKHIRLKRIVLISCIVVLFTPMYNTLFETIAKQL